jgi:hypothetical protein
MSRFWSLRTQFKGDYPIPSGSALEPEPTPFLNVGFPFFVVDDGDKFPPGDDDDEPFPDS